MSRCPKCGCITIPPGTYEVTGCNFRQLTPLDEYQKVEQTIDRMESLGFDFAFFAWSEDGTCSALFYRPEDHDFCIDNLLDDKRVVTGKDKLQTILLAAQVAEEEEPPAPHKAPRT